MIAAEREGNNLKGFKHFCLQNGSSQGHNLALTVLFVLNSLAIGSGQEAMTVACEELAGLFVAYLVKIVKANLPKSFADNKFEEKAWEIAKVQGYLAHKKQHLPLGPP